MAWSIAVLVFSGLVVTFSRRVMIHSLTDIHSSHIRFPLSTLTAAFQREDTSGGGYSPDPCGARRAWGPDYTRALQLPSNMADSDRCYGPASLNSAQNLYT